MTYYEAYRQLDTVEAVVEAAKHDTLVALFLNPDSVKPIEDAVNRRIAELEAEPIGNAASPDMV